MKMYTVSPAFKNAVTEILGTQKFSAVFPYMNLINREGFTYTEEELNSFVQFLGEFPYTQVAEFFRALPELVKEQTEEPTVASATDVAKTKKSTVKAEASVEAVNK
jgi:hypothetical protein